jgi:RHS repeat-associated protein
VASQVSSGEWRYHHYDGQGNCILLTDTGGAIREQYDYDAFGMPYVYDAGGFTLGAAAQWGNRFLFTGREWLGDLRIYDYRARQYQPELGRFLQPDPKEFAAGDYNLYRYCHNDPVNKSDPTGLESVIATIWNRLMHEMSGSFLSSSQFDSVRQGTGALVWSTPKQGAAAPDGHGQIGSAGSPAWNQPGKPDYALRSIERAYKETEGDTIYVHVFWRIQLFHHNQTPVGRGIQVRELIDWSEKVDFKAKDVIKAEYPTRDDGSVNDPWKLPFSSQNGQVKTSQTVLAGGRVANWDATVKVDGENGHVERSQQYAEFTEPPP